MPKEAFLYYTDQTMHNAARVNLRDKNCEIECSWTWISLIPFWNCHLNSFLHATMERIWNYGKKKIDLDIWHQSKFLLCCFYIIGYINKIVYRRSLYIRTSMFQRCVPRVINCVSCKLWLLPFDFFPLIAWYNFLRHCRKKTSLQ